MAAAPTIPSRVFQNHSSSGRNNNNHNDSEFGREEIRAAIAKAVELRALHAALTQGNSPANINRCISSSSSSPVSRPVSHFSAHDYPVFTPSYEDEHPVLRYHPIHSKNPSGNWDEYALDGGTCNESTLSDFKKEILSLKKGMPPGLANFESHICPADDQKSVTASCTNHITVLQTSPGTDVYKSSRRNSMGDFKSVSSCNRCKPAVVTSNMESVSRSIRSSNIVVPLTDTHSSVKSQPRGRGGVMSWLFPRLKKKHKGENSPNRTEPEDVVSQVYKDLGLLSVDTLRRELIEVTESREAALMEASEMRSSVGELRQKLDYLETYCEELKKALSQATQAKENDSHQVNEKLGNFPRRGKSVDGNGESMMPVSEEVMVEGFLQIVSEARLSVKQFCKILVAQIEETDQTLLDNMNLLLQPYKLSISSKYSKAVLYHLEGIINQSLYQDFENCVFQKNGSPKHLDPQLDRQEHFASFLALRNLSWNEVLRKGTKYYSEEFSKFCDKKMSSIITTLNWTRPWPEQLLQAFFVAAKCIWLLHLLAFSFNPPLGILRVQENRNFDAHYMEDMSMDRQKSYGPSRVKLMVMPGFYVRDKVLRCKVLCRYKSAP